MFFSQDDKASLLKIQSSMDGNKTNLQHLCKETNDLVIVIRNLVVLVEQMANDYETLKSRMIALENKCTVKLPPKLPIPQKKK